jgi:hypothetical protein
MRQGAAIIAGLLGLGFLGAGLVQVANGVEGQITLLGGLLVLVMALVLGLAPLGRSSVQPPVVPRPVRQAAPPVAAPAPPPVRPGTRQVDLPGASLPLHPDDLDERLLTAIKGLSPADFEHFCRVLLEEMGYAQVQVQGKTGDEGIDLTMYHSGVLVIAQCKRYQSNVGAPAVRDFYGTLMHTRATHGFFITTSDFTHAAREWAQGKPLDLINGSRLIAAVRRYLLADILQ